MPAFLAVIIGVVVGIGLGYGFRGWIARKKNQAEDKIQAEASSFAKKI